MNSVLNGWCDEGEKREAVNELCRSRRRSVLKGSVCSGIYIFNRSTIDNTCRQLQLTRNALERGEWRRKKKPIPASCTHDRVGWKGMHTCRSITIVLHRVVWTGALAHTHCTYTTTAVSEWASKTVFITIHQLYRSIVLCALKVHVPQLGIGIFSFVILFISRFIFIIHCRISLARSFNHTLANDRTVSFLFKRATLCTLNSLAFTCSFRLHCTREVNREIELHVLSRKFPVEIPNWRQRERKNEHTIIKSHNWVCFEHRHRSRGTDRGGKYGVYVNAFISATIAHTINKHSHNAFNAYRIFWFSTLFYCLRSHTKFLFVCLRLKFIKCSLYQ